MWAAVALVLLTALASGCACDLSADVGPATEPIEVVEGKLLSIELDSRIGGDDHHRAILQTATGEVEFLVSGRSDVLRIGSSYEVGLIGNQIEGESVAFLGSNGTCGYERTTIRQLDQSGTAFDIELPRRIPSWPISRNQLLIGFGILAALTFVFREQR